MHACVLAAEVGLHVCGYCAGLHVVLTHASCGLMHVRAFLGAQDAIQIQTMEWAEASPSVCIAPCGLPWCTESPVRVHVQSAVCMYQSSDLGHALIRGMVVGRGRSPAWV